MKKIIQLFFLCVFALISCETTIEDNTPALQSNVDDAFFKANGARATLTDNGGIIIQGSSNNEVLTMELENTQLTSYTVGEGSFNTAVFERFDGQIYTTSPFGSGSITLTEECLPCGYYSGEFNFMAVNLTRTDTLAFGGGIFFEVPLTGGGINSNGGTGSLSAEIDNIPFTAVSISATNSGNSIVISARNSSDSFFITIPNDIMAGDFPVSMQGLTLSYTNDAGTQSATSGNLSIITHNINTNTISGTFSFLTDSHVIESGAFNVTY